MSTVAVTESNFAAEVLQSQEPVLIDFWATWCAPCKAMEPDLEAISEEFAGRVKIAKINADDCPGLAAQYNVRGLPTLVVVKNGEAVDMRNGSQPRSKLSQWLTSVA